MKFTSSTTGCTVLFSLLSRASSAPAPAPEPALQLLGRAGLAKVYSGCTTTNTVALTFDDGPYIYETEVSNLLKQNGIKGTFFVNGNNYDCIYDQRQVTSLKNAFAAGHQIGSHTWAHKDLSTLTWDQIHDEMWRVELALSRIIGAKPAFMRPPYGSYNNLVREASLIRNQSLVLWDFDSGDSVGASVAESEKLYTDIAKQRPNTLLALNHETYETTVEQILPFAIQKLKAAGYKFATVAECLGGKQAYFWTGHAGTRDGSWVC